MSLPARVRLLLARSPWLYWAFVAALAACAGYLVMRAASNVEAARDEWGSARTVIVAIGDVAPGAPLVGVVERRELPAPMVPPAALEAVDEAAIARQPVAAGEVIVAHDVAPSGAPQSLIPPGWLAVAVSEPVPAGAGIGDAVSVASGGILLAPDGVVVATADDDVVLVAVPADEAPHVARAASTGDVALLLKP
jgi:hypothetical protein